MDIFKRFIDIYIPVTACNLNCHYCYISKSNRRGVEAPKMEYTPEYIGRALSQERLGGVTLFNMCGWGETMLLPNLFEITGEILKQGHYIWIVTNGLIENRINEMMQLPQEYLERLAFKFSFHYLELIRLNKMDQFFKAIETVKKAGCSFTVELTSCDELEEHINDMKKLVRERIGANLQVTIPRDGGQKHYPLLSKHSVEEYNEIWKTFDSEMFDFKMSLWGQKREEYCYAGCWSGLLNISNGEFKACYSSALRQNIFLDLNKPIKFIPIGKHCKMSHCHNSHAFLAMGVIPEIDTSTYEKIRNRKCEDGTEWVNEKMKAFISQRLCDNNKHYKTTEKVILNVKYHAITKTRILKRKLKGLE